MQFLPSSESGGDVCAAKNITEFYPDPALSCGTRRFSVFFCFFFFGGVGFASHLNVIASD